VLPSFYEYLTYIFFFPCCVCGPSFDYKDFIDFIEEKGNYENVPFSIKELAINFLQVIYCVVMYFGLGKYYPLEKIFLKSFLEISLFFRCNLLQSLSLISKKMSIFSSVARE